jgi:DNA invertase Pin-like site-specific DNA recombinase
MRCGIYARKSTSQDVTDDAKSVTRQVEHATAYATAKGWTIDPAHVYVDDGISGAEFAKRPGFVRLMAALKPTPPFAALIMSEESRLGREQIETAYALKQLMTAGVRVFFYLEDRERTLESPTDKLLLSVTSFADEMEREKARQRTHDALVRKAPAGHVPGGVCFGYDNQRVDGHVARVVNATEAAVVVRIFEMAASGQGVRKIAHVLNGEHVPGPTPRRAGRPRSWSPSALPAMLTRPLYRGEVVWNRSQKRDTWGVKKQTARPEGEWVRHEVPTLSWLETSSAPVSRWRVLTVQGRKSMSHGDGKAARGGGSDATVRRHSADGGLLDLRNERRVNRGGR